MTRRLLLWLALWLCPWAASAAVTFDAVTVSGGSADFGDATFAHTVAADADVLVVCTSTSISSTVNDITSITYAGQALTQLNTVSNGAGAHAELWYKLAPATGVNNVVVNAADDPWFVYIAMSFKGVAQQAPVGATASGTDATPTVNVSSAAGAIVADCLSVFAEAGTTITVHASQTQRANTQHDNAIGGAASTEAGAAPTVTMSWALDSSRAWTLAVMSLEQAVAPVGRRRIRNIYP
jgi:hypothetical protein